jgi:ABC-type glycerol-3-phosphate transport system substrate-binding protein
LNELARQGLHDGRRQADGPAARPERDRPLHNKDLFDQAGVPYPDDTWDWQKLVDVAKQLTKDSQRRRQDDQWGLYTETTDMENTGHRSSGRTAATSPPRTATTALDTAGDRRAAVPPGPDLEGQDRGRRLFAETGDAFEQGKAAMEINDRLVATDEAAGLKFGIAPSRRDPPAG